MGILQEANREFFHPLGFALEVVPKTGMLAIQDHTEDPEGVIFAPGTMHWSNFWNFNYFRNTRAIERLRKLGYIVQAPSESPSNQFPQP
jgi:hypothetical protein